MPTYIVHYTYEGVGTCEVEADSIEEAEEKFEEGEFENDKEEPTEYAFDYAELSNETEE